MPIYIRDTSDNIEGDLGATMGAFTAAFAGANTPTPDFDGALDRGLNAFRASLRDFSLPTTAELSAFGYLVPEDYGAEGDGVTDDTAALNAAMLDASTTGRTVLLQGGKNYLVSDTVRCGSWTQFQEIKVHGLGGTGTSVARAKITLADNSPNHDGTGTERPVVCFRMFVTTDGSPTFAQGVWPANPLAGESRSNYAFGYQWYNIDIDCGNNSDAFGIFLSAAQDSSARDVTITATNAKGGWWGCLGRQGPMMNIKIIGGEWAIRNRDLPGSTGANTAGGSVIHGLTIVGDANMLVPIENQDFVPMTIVGFDISQPTTNSIFTIQSSSRTMYNQIVMVEGKISTGGGTVFNNSEGKSIYLRTVYITGTNNLVQSGSEATVTGTGTWKRINEYVYTDPTSTNAASSQYATSALIDGTVTPGSSNTEPATSVSSSVSAPSVDYVNRHIVTFEHIDHGPYVNAEDFGADGSTLVYGNNAYQSNRDNTSFDSAEAIQAAIDEAQAVGHNRVFIPRGSYYIGSTITLRADTKLIGGGDGMTILHTHGSWRPTSNVFMIDTTDVASGTAQYQAVGIHCREIDGTGNGSTTPYQFAWFSGMRWRTGSASAAIWPELGREFYTTPGLTQGPRYFMVITGNGGGKHMLCGPSGRRWGHEDNRVLLISGTSQPLQCYGPNPEGTKRAPTSADEMTVNVEVTGASNVRLYGSKREGESATLLINNSTNIAAYGYGRSIETDKAGVGYVVKVQGTSNNILIGILSTGDSGTWSATTQGHPEDAVNTAEIQFPTACSLFKIGTIDDSATAID